MDFNQERMEAKMDDRQEEMKAQVSSLASQIVVNQDEMKAMLNACLEKMEANPGELQSVAVHQDVPREDVIVEMIGALKDRYLAVGCC
jgi:N-acetylglutamate synthase-like GNAT family acetyltransferase